MDSKWADKTSRQQLPKLEDVEKAIGEAMAVLKNEVDRVLHVYGEWYDSDKGEKEKKKFEDFMGQLTKLALCAHHYSGVETKVATLKEEFTKCLQDDAKFFTQVPIPEDSKKILDDEKSLFNEKYAGEVFDKAWTAMQEITKPQITVSLY